MNLCVCIATPGPLGRMDPLGFPVWHQRCHILGTGHDFNATGNPTHTNCTGVRSYKKAWRSSHIVKVAKTKTLLHRAPRSGLKMYLSP